MPISAGMLQKQTSGMVPEHIIGKAVLKMSLTELQEFVQAAVCENPALSPEEGRLCPVCGSPLAESICVTCGSTVMTDGDPEPAGGDDWRNYQRAASADWDEAFLEPFSRVASPTRLADHLMEQVRTYLRKEDVRVGEFIVDCLDEDGYLHEPLFDIASRFGLSVPEAESVLRRVQILDPPGIAARSVQECLLIQLRQLEVERQERWVAETLIANHWDCLSRMKLDEAARRMGVDKDAVQSAVRFIRESLNPHPASMFRDPWQMLAPRGVCALPPDVAVRHFEFGLMAEVLDPLSSRITIDQTYGDLYAQICRKKSSLDGAEVEHVRDCVLKAKSLIEALEFRKLTLRKVADELVRRQADFFVRGPSALKPMTRKEIAREIAVHESTVSRAIQDKTIRVPTGEVIPLDLLFDAALPVKEIISKLAVQHLSDAEIAGMLRQEGIAIARRTVAKYRGQLRMPSIEYRLPDAA